MMMVVMMVMMVMVIMMMIMIMRSRVDRMLGVWACEDDAGGRMCEGGSHLHNPAVGANRQVRPTTHPFHRRDDVDRLGRVAQVAQLRHL
jgi:hypothetical protein